MSFHWMRTRSIMAAFGVAAFLSACGGGGSEPIVASTLPFSVKAAYTTQFADAKTLSFNLSGVSGGVAVTGTGVLTRSSLPLSTFEGKDASLKVTTFTGTQITGAASVPLAVTVNEYVDKNVDPMGLTNSRVGEYEVVVGPVTIPFSAKVGDSGAIYSANRYTSSSKTQLLGTRTYSYRLEAATATTATLKIIGIYLDVGGNATGSNTVVFEVTASGGVTRKSETSVTGSDTLTVSYAS